MAESGLVVVDKPQGLTSHDVVARIRRLAGTRKVGHAGTLDPMATGVLVVGVERATRLLTYLVGADKEYRATVRLGVGTHTDDAEGEVTSTPGFTGDLDRVDVAIRPLRGAIEQRPSSVSAIKVNGKRAYARVRDGEDVTLPPRAVTVHELEVLGARAQRLDDGTPVLDVDVRVVCSSGTYIRALARDLGENLGSAGHLTMLRRTRVGPYGLDVAATLPQLEESFTALPMARAARAAFPARELTDDEARRLAHGQRLSASGHGEPTAAFAPDGGLVALVADAGETAKPLVVLVG
ncbi:tRNA pseudouridine(55) synthase TruB [Spongisporangium articulatum]|uniref:tRNA pseudouridine synthase B n=1 Tax=Spongisporangium articulatum TaxID=3362603 RepID=A0ABW8AMS8_9ACTN